MKGPDCSHRYLMLLDGSPLPRERYIGGSGYKQIRNLTTPEGLTGWLCLELCGAMWKRREDVR